MYKKLIKYTYNVSKSIIFTIGALSISSYLLNYQTYLNEKSTLYDNDVILTLDLSKNINEFTTIIQDPFSNLLMKLQGKSPLTMFDLYKSLKIAQDDPNVKGLIVHVQNSPHSPAIINEISSYIKQFQKNKFTLCYANQLTMNDYHLASYFNYIFLSNSISSDILFTDISSTINQLFFKSFFNTYGIDFDYIKLKDYKTAINIFTEDQFTTEHKQQIITLYSDIRQQMIDNISSNRQLNDVESLMIHGPYLSDQLIHLNLIDAFLPITQLAKITNINDIKHIITNDHEKNTAGLTKDLNNLFPLTNKPTFLSLQTYYRYQKNQKKDQ